MVTNDLDSAKLEGSIVEELLISDVGTLAYMSPERANKCPYGASSDWWSIGIILYELLCGVTPFEADTLAATRQNILDNSNLLELICSYLIDITWPGNISERARSLILELLEPHPARRAVNAENILEHAFFESFHWGNVLNTTPPLIPRLSQSIEGRYFEGGLGLRS